MSATSAARWMGGDSRMTRDLKGKSVLITGASRGIGAAIVIAMAQAGCRLHLAARDSKRLEANAATLLRDHGAEAHIHAVDLSVRSEVARLGAACGDVDILVNNAGDIPLGGLEDLDPETWRNAWDLKVYGYVDLSRMIYPNMCKRRNGVIINIVGAAGKRANYNYIAGCMANAALDMFTQCLGGESMRHGVRVVSVDPGPTNSDRHLAHVKQRAKRQLGDESLWPQLQAKFPAGRAANVEEVANVVTFLASGAASYISGTSIRVDGGISASRSS